MWTQYLSFVDDSVIPTISLCILTRVTDCFHSFLTFPRGVIMGFGSVWVVKRGPVNLIYFSTSSMVS